MPTLLPILLTAALSVGSPACTAADLMAAREHTPTRALLEGKHKTKLGDKPGARDTDKECGEWKVGTATGEWVGVGGTRGSGGRCAGGALPS